MGARRLWGIALALLCGEACGQVRLLVQSSPLAGVRYHAAAEVWPQLRVGDPLELGREPANPHDANAISVSWRGRKLGYLPRRENAAAAWSLDRGQALRARIARISSRGRIEIELYAE